MQVHEKTLFSHRKELSMNAKVKAGDLVVSATPCTRFQHLQDAGCFHKPCLVVSTFETPDGVEDGIWVVTPASRSSRKYAKRLTTYLLIGEGDETAVKEKRVNHSRRVYSFLR